MQMFACKNQKRLGEFIEDAWEWDGAKRAAAEESLSDWDTLGSENDCVSQRVRMAHARTHAQSHG